VVNVGCGFANEEITLMLSSLLFAVDETAKQTSSEPGGGLLSLLPFAGIAVLFYFLMIAPMRRQEKQRQALVSTLKKNDKIINSGGIIGIVESVKEKENEVVLRGGLRVTKASIVQVVSEDPSKEQKDGGA
jgi:preprotein translocase subunit YajC